MDEYTYTFWKFCNNYAPHIVFAMTPSRDYPWAIDPVSALVYCAMLALSED